MDLIEYENHMISIFWECKSTFKQINMLKVLKSIHIKTEPYTMDGFGNTERINTFTFYIRVACKVWLFTSTKLEPIISYDAYRRTIFVYEKYADAWEEHIKKFHEIVLADLELHKSMLTKSDTHSVLEKTKNEMKSIIKELGGE